jgi:hypothetical protein
VYLRYIQTPFSWTGGKKEKLFKVIDISVVRGVDILTTVLEVMPFKMVQTLWRTSEDSANLEI